jgi:GMP synthase-like glutamine amidotransferase
MKHAVCLQHVPFEGPAYFGTLLAERGYCVEKHLVPDAGLPGDGGDFLLVMGGPMSVNDPDAWIDEETAFIRRHVEQGLPYLGICLGSQFLAKAMGGRVYKGAAPEIGMTTIRLTEAGRADAALRGWPAEPRVLEWHGEGIDLPPGSAGLASTDLFPVQAFRCGERAYGLLFHLEMDPDACVAICCGCGEDVAKSGRTAGQLVDELRAHVPALQRCAASLVDALTRGSPVRA